MGATIFRDFGVAPDLAPSCPRMSMFNNGHYETRKTPKTLIIYTLLDVVGRY